jgi:superfamily I DNA/RNA helicase
MTRARQGLYLSWARKRTLDGRKLEAGPSRFLEKLEELVPLIREENRKPRDIQGRLF